MKTRQLDYRQLEKDLELCGIVTWQRHLPNALLQILVVGTYSFINRRPFTETTASALASLHHDVTVTLKFDPVCRLELQSVEHPSIRPLQTT